jgi:hypothetical protein
LHGHLRRPATTASTAPADPLALDPLSPLPARRGDPLADTRVPADPLALDPLSPIRPPSPR